MTDWLDLSDVCVSVLELDNFCMFSVSLVKFMLRTKEWTEFMISPCSLPVFAHSSHCCQSVPT